MASIDVEAVVRAVVRPSPWRRARRIAVVPREPGAQGFGLTMLLRKVGADPRVVARFGVNVSWVTAGAEAGRPGGTLGIRYRRNARLAGTPPPFHHWVLAEERILRGYRRLLLVVDDVRHRYGDGWPSNVAGHVNLTGTTDPSLLSAGNDIIPVDAAAIEAEAAAAVPATMAAEAGALGVFAPGEPVSLALVGAVWGVPSPRPLAEELASLSLVHLDRDTVTISPAVRAVPPPEGALDRLLAVPELDDYLWEHRVTHLVEAGRPTPAADLRWIAARLVRTGPAGPLRDLVVAGVPPALCTAYEEAASRLDPTDPPSAILDTLCNSLRDHELWGPQVEALRTEAGRPMLVTRAPLSDSFTGLGGWGLDVSPDGTRLAVAGGGKFVTVTDTVTGAEVVSCKCYSQAQSVVFGPDGTWLAVRTHDRAYMPSVEDPPESTTVQVWSVPGGERLFEVKGGWRRQIRAMALSADGTHLGVSRESGVEVWDWRANRVVPPVEFGPWLPVHVREAERPDGAWRAAIDGAELRLTEPRTGTPGPMTRVSGTLHGLRWLAGGGVLVYGDYGIAIFDVATAADPG